jgi:hypothetical protein
MMATLNQLFDKVLAIPGVAEIVKPTREANNATKRWGVFLRKRY